MPKDFLIRFQRMDYLISRKATGSPDVFAAKLNLSKRMLFEYLSDLKELGAPLMYDRERETYFYDPCGNFKIKVEENI